MGPAWCTIRCESGSKWVRKAWSSPRSRGVLKRTLRAESTKLQGFANSSGQIRVLVEITGIDLAKPQDSATLRLSLMGKLGKDARRR